MTKNKVLRILTVSLVLGIVASIMISCAKKDQTDTDTSDSQASISAVNTEEETTKGTDKSSEGTQKPSEGTQKPSEGSEESANTQPKPVQNPQTEPTDDTAQDNF